MKNYNKKFLSFFVVIFLFLLIFSPLMNRAQAGDEEGTIVLNEELKNFRTGAGLGEADLGEVIGKVVKGALSILGLVCVVIFVMAGIQWMNSGGHKEKIAGAQKSMGAAIIGLIIMIGAYAAVNFITKALSTVTKTAG